MLTLQGKCTLAKGHVNARGEMLNVLKRERRGHERHLSCAYRGARGSATKVSARIYLAFASAPGKRSTRSPNNDNDREVIDIFLDESDDDEDYECNTAHVAGVFGTSHDDSGCACFTPRTGTFSIIGYC